MALTVGEIARSIERLATPALAESWDNVGLLVGDPARTVATVLVALDPSAAVLAQVADRRAELLVTHHPLIFSPLKRVTEDGNTASLVRQCIVAGCSVIAAHTNLDSAPEGLNTHVARLLGLREPRPLVPSDSRGLLKLVVYVPDTHAEAVRAAICGAGAGQIGRYSDCTFSAAGTGTFRPGPDTHPFIGETGVLARVPELRLETVVPRPHLCAVLRALHAAHPYEEVAYDLLPLENRWPDAGLGRIGQVEPTTAGAFLARVRAALAVPRALLAGDPARPVRTVALCTGAGGDFLDAAGHAGADLYLTAEIKHHQALRAHQRGLAVIDAGHFATEHPASALLGEYLREQFPALTSIRAEESDPLGA